MSQRRTVICLICCLMLSITGISRAEASEVIGKVLLAVGQPQLQRGDQLLLLKRHSPLQEGDLIKTGNGARVMLQLADKTRINLAENSEFALARYRFDATAQTSDVRFQLARGAFRAVSGLIGKQANPKLEVATPVATIGIRGTDFWGGFLFSEALDVTMISGKGIYIYNDQGRVDIDTGGEGTTVAASQAPAPPVRWSAQKVSQAAAATAVQE